MLSELNISTKITADDIGLLREYFYDPEVYYANGEDQNYYGLSDSRLDDICNAVDDLNLQEGACRFEHEAGVIT